MYKKQPSDIQFLYKKKLGVVIQNIRNKQTNKNLQVVIQRSPNVIHPIVFPPKHNVFTGLDGFHARALSDRIPRLT